MKIAIIIPAYNEENRIGKTIVTYQEFFKDKQPYYIDYIVVNNGSRDNTVGLIKELQKKFDNLYLINCEQAGKGLAIAAGFKEAAAKPYDLIGFVDADMATSPAAYYNLILAINGYDGVIASRYMPGAVVVPPRPFIKRWGSKLFFESLVRLLFGIHYYDTQCGAKLFTHAVITKITPYLTVKQWAFDIELLYLCKRFGFRIKELPTQWHDQAGSKLRMFRSGMRMIASLFSMRWHYRNKLLFFLMIVSMFN